VRSGSRPPYSETARGSRGFTLLELTIAMTFVVLLASGITLSLSTCLNVWRRSQEAAELHQEARAIMELLSRDIRGAYLGLDKNAGYFLGMPAAEEKVPIDVLEFCTESSSVARLALLPDEERSEWDEVLRPVVTDYIAVRYEYTDTADEMPAGLYRTTWAVPIFEWSLLEFPPNQPLNSELISAAVIALRFQYFDGESWTGTWMTTEDERRLPQAVAIKMTLRDARENDHEYHSIITIPAR